MIYLDFNNIGHYEKDYIARALDVGQISTASPFVDEFEKDIMFVCKKIKELM